MTTHDPAISVMKRNCNFFPAHIVQIPKLHHKLVRIVKTTFFYEPADFQLNGRKLVNLSSNF